MDKRGIPVLMTQESAPTFLRLCVYQRFSRMFLSVLILFVRVCAWSQRRTRYKRTSALTKVGLFTNYCGVTSKRYYTRLEFFGFFVPKITAEKYLAEPCSPVTCTLK